MFRTFRRIALLSAFSASAAAAQTAPPASAPDSADPGAQNTVKAYSIKSGKLILSTAANPVSVNLPDGTFTNESGTILVVVNGSLTRLQQGTGEIVEIGAIRINRQQQIRLIPSTNALMAVTEMPLPSGTFNSEDGLSSFKILSGRPVELKLPAPAAGKEPE